MPVNEEDEDVRNRNAHLFNTMRYTNFAFCFDAKVNNEYNV